MFRMIMESLLSVKLPGKATALPWRFFFITEQRSVLKTMRKTQINKKQQGMVKPLQYFFLQRTVPMLMKRTMITTAAD